MFRDTQRFGLPRLASPPPLSRRHGPWAKGTRSRSWWSGFLTVRARTNVARTEKAVTRRTDRITVQIVQIIFTDLHNLLPVVQV